MSLTFQADYLETDYELYEYFEQHSVASSPPRTPRVQTPLFEWDQDHLDYLEYLCALGPNYEDIEEDGFSRNLRLNPSPNPVEIDSGELHFDEVFQTGEEDHLENEYYHPPTTPVPEDPSDAEMAIVPIAEDVWNNEFSPPPSPPFDFIADEVYAYYNQEYYNDNARGHSVNEYSPPRTPRFDHYDDEDDDVFFADFPDLYRARG